jgi:phage-related protein
MKVIPALTEFLKKLNESGIIQAFANNLDLVGVALGTLLTLWGVVSVIEALNTVMGLNPMARIVLAVIALLGVLAYLEVKFKIFSNTINWVSQKGTAAFKAISDAAQKASDWIVAKWDGMTDFFARVWDTTIEAFNTVKQVIGDFVDGALQFLSDKLNDLKGFIDEHQVAIRNWAIVIATILAPKLVQLGVQAAVAAAKAVAAWAISIAGIIAHFAIMAAQAAIQLAKTVGAFITSAAKAAFVWVTQTLPQIILGFAKMAAQAAINVAKVSATFIMESIKIGIRWAIMFGQFAIGMGIMVAQFLIQAGRMAIGWLMALGPLGAIVAAIIGVGALIVTNWEAVKGFFIAAWELIASGAAAAWAWIQSAWGTVVDFFGGVWNGIVAIFGGVAGWFGGVFNGAWDMVRSAFSAVGSFFGGVWDTIVNTFTKIGTSIGDAIGGGVKGVVNSILGFAEEKINGFIDAINVAVDVINKIPGVSIGKLGRLNVGRLASGTPNFLGGLTMVGERGPEIAALPQGTRVMSATETRNAMGNRGGNSSIVIEKMEVKNGVDANELLRSLSWRLSLL